VLATTPAPSKPVQDMPINNFQPCTMASTMEPSSEPRLDPRSITKSCPATDGRRMCRREVSFVERLLTDSVSAVECPVADGALTCDGKLSLPVALQPSSSAQGGQESQSSTFPCDAARLQGSWHDDVGSMRESWCALLSTSPDGPRLSFSFAKYSSTPGISC